MASPSNFGDYYACVRRVRTTGGAEDGTVFSNYGARGVVTLSPSIEIESGTGTYTDPYVVGPLVTRTN